MTKTCVFMGKTIEPQALPNISYKVNNWSFANRCISCVSAALL
jgi:hypothetical protein